MLKFTKLLSIVIFKRYFKNNSFILFFPKYYLHNLQLPFLNLKKYVLENVYTFNLSSYNISNLLCFAFSSKDVFFKYIYQNYLKIFGIKYNNIFFNPNFLVNNKNFFSISLKKFLFKLKFLFTINLKFIYSFRRLYK